MTSSISSPTIGLVRLPHGESLSLPAYETAGAAGMDLRAAVRDDARVILTPGRRALIPTGFILQLPEGFEAQIRPRSGLALKYGVTCLNTPGTIDSDYRGEIQVLLINLGHDDFQITRGMRIAQMVISPVVQARLDVRVAANTTDRGDGGFGSTGSQ